MIILGTYYVSIQVYANPAILCCNNHTYFNMQAQLRKKLVIITIITIVFVYS